MGGESLVYEQVIIRYAVPAFITIIYNLIIMLYVYSINHININLWDIPINLYFIH